jgi:hypothetical protein
MKILLISLGVLAAAFLIFQLYSLIGNKTIETYPYSTLQKYDRFEIRKYEASLFTAVNMKTDQYGQAANRGFSILAGYIFGGNKTKEKIAMTSPVAMTLEDSMTMMFMVPKSYTKDQLPKPNRSNIEFRDEPEKVVAVIQFGGWASTKKIEKYRKKLIAALEKEGIAYTNLFYYLGYNPPYELINRKNEIIVELPETP